MASQKEIVIVGGGIIGCCTAYYLATHPLFHPASCTITLIEASRSGVAQGASGKAGGLVAKWAYPRELVDISFAEHVKLAELHGGSGSWGWRYVKCGRWEGRMDTSDGITSGIPLQKVNSPHTSQRNESSSLPPDLDWVKEELTESYSSMAADGDTAQVHPYLFTSKIFQLAETRGVTLIPGRATRIIQHNGKVSGVEYISNASGKALVVPATHVVLAAGAWSDTLVSILPMATTRAHSITIQPESAAEISPYVLFTDIIIPSADGKRSVVSPEIYARPSNEVYLCGPGDSEPLPPTVDEVVLDNSACELLETYASSVSNQLRSGVVTKRQACYLPLIRSGGGPIVGPAPMIGEGLYIAVGHTCWGICNAPGTGKLISEFIMNGRTVSGKLRKLDPSRFI